MHGGAGILHALRHILCHLVCAMQLQGRHAETLLGDLCSLIVAAVGERRIDFLECEQVITHVGQCVLDQLGRKCHKLAGVGRRLHRGLMRAVALVLRMGQANRENRDACEGCNLNGAAHDRILGSTDIPR